MPRCRVEYYVALEPPGTKNWPKTVGDAKKLLSAAGITRSKDAVNKFTHYNALVAVLTLAIGKEEQQELSEAEDATIPENVSPEEKAKWESGIAWQSGVANNLRKEKPGANMWQLARGSHYGESTANTRGIFELPRPNPPGC